MQLIQRYPQFVDHLLGQRAEFRAMSPVEPPHGNLIRPAGDALPGIQRTPEVIRTERFQMPEELAPQVDEDNVVVRGNRRGQVGCWFFVVFAAEAVPRLVEVTM